jgi:hypothetical protein
MNFTGTVLPILNVRIEFPQVPPVPSAPPMGGRKPVNWNWHETVRVTVKVQEALLPAASVAVHVTGVVPSGKFEPEGGLHT